jgi:hypothetical protein
VTINPDAHTEVGNSNAGGSDGNLEPDEYSFNLDLSACHELGHTVGLVHHNAGYFSGFNSTATGNGCQVNQWREVELNQSGWRRISPHHRDHINNDSPTY